MSEVIHIPGVSIEGEVARGGQSLVLRGRRGEHHCAIKLAAEGPHAARAFRREAYALARVRDPGVPAVLDVGEVGGRAYLVMELVEGTPLADLIRLAPMTERQALRLAQGLAGTLAAVHARGLVHRDVKPHNIVVEDESGAARLVDFGLAAELSPARTLEAAGTGAYAAPEQIRFPEMLDGRADLYALGRVLHECVTGSPRGLPGTESSPAELEASGFSPRFARVLARLLARNPADRYPTAEALAVDLDRIATGTDPLPLEVHDPESSRAPLVGRAAELDVLRQRWADACSGSGRLVRLHGVRGVGKSRVLTAFGQEVRRTGAPVLTVRCAQLDQRPLEALSLLLDQYATVLGSRLHEERVRLRKALRDTSTAPLGSLLLTVAPTLVDVVDTPDDASPRLPEGHDAFLETLSAAVAQLAEAAGPTLLCIDDVSLLDSVSREVLARLAHRASALPVMLVVTSRTGEQGTASVARFNALEGRHVSTLEVEPFRVVHAEQLLRAELSTEDLPPDLARWVSRLADGTPLGVLEMLRSACDAGCLRPHWGTWEFDRDRAARLSLPGSVTAVLTRRLDDLQPDVRKALEGAAVVGHRFDDALVTKVGEFEGEASTLLEEARAALLVERLADGAHRFVHDWVREALLHGVDDRRRRALHQRIARALDTAEGLDSTVLPIVARHYAAGIVEDDPQRVVATNRKAGEQAAEAFDHEQALTFFDAARRADDMDGSRLAADAAFHRGVGESHLCLGALRASLEAFSRALASTTEPIERAGLLSRRAWVEHMSGEPDAACLTLEAAFAELGHDVPKSPARTTGTAVAALVRGRVRSQWPRPASGHRALELSVLCELHYQYARLGQELGRAGQLLTSVVKLSAAAEELATPRALNRSRSMAGCVVMMLTGGRRGAGLLEDAENIARQHGDAAGVAFCAQHRCTGAALVGRFDESLHWARRYLDDHGHSVESSEFLSVIYNAYIMEALRGRSVEAWAWLARGIDRVVRVGRTPPAFSRVVIHCVIGALVTLGREEEVEPLLARLHLSEAETLRATGFYRQIAWGARLRRFSEAAVTGSSVDELIAEFEAEGYDPRRAHPVLSDWYLSLAHLRLHECIRSDAAGRHSSLQRLRRAISDVHWFRRLGVLRAHLDFLEGAEAWLHGDVRKARRKLQSAEYRASTDANSWVLHSVARVRAHMLRDEGREDAAMSQARVALLTARQQGAVHRARLIRDEFAVALPSDHGSPHGSSDYVTRWSSARRRRLRALVALTRTAHGQPQPEQQARTVLDEIVRAVSADVGYLSFTPGGLKTDLRAARSSGQADAPPPDERRQAFMRWIRSADRPWAPTWDGEPSWTGDHGLELPVDPTRIIALPLFTQDEPAGVVYLERAPASDPFSPEDGELAISLAGQAAVALDLAHSLLERDELRDRLQQAQKLEAVGQLAGGVAHDFNNTLTAIFAGLDGLRRSNLPEESQEDLEFIGEAARKAHALTQQLLSFSRRQSLAPQTVDLRLAVPNVAPMIERLIGDHIRVEVEVDPDIRPVRIDPAGLDQAIVNLAINSRDAMPEGGHLRIDVHAATLDDRDARARGVRAGDYTVVAVADDGEGIPEELRGRILEPFFTTKQPGQGTGLGLSSVHSLVDRSGGWLDIESEVGVGTTIRFGLPVTDRKARITEPPRERPSGSAGETVLVVEDDTLVRNALRRTLEHRGYRVLLASDAASGTTLARQHLREIDMLVTDVLMPGGSGPDLVRRLRESGFDRPVLYVSGYTDGQLVEGVLSSGASFLPKPFSSTALLRRVRELLDEAPPR